MNPVPCRVTRVPDGPEAGFRRDRRGAPDALGPAGVLEVVLLAERRREKVAAGPGATRVAC